jgi:CTP:molybdopterin cytidylyltransferase MocA
VTVGGLVLAAGEGRRLGRAKALIELDGERLVDRAVRALRVGGCGVVTVVLGAAVVDVPDADLIVVNERWPDGMGSSLRAGLAAQPPGVDAVVVTLVDQPGIGPAAVRRFVAAYDGGATVAVATYGGQRRNPVLLASGHWDEVSRLAQGDVGARPFLASHPDLVVELPCDDVADPADIDTAEDLKIAEAP